MDQIFSGEVRQEEFERQGFTVVRLLSAGDAAQLLERIDAVRAALSPVSHEGGYLDQSFCTPNAEYRQRIDAIGSEAVRERLLSLLPGYRLVAAGVMIKKPGGGPMGIHRDRSILPDLDQVAVDVWCPLVDMDDDYGNLAMLPGSHKLGNVETAGVKRFYEDYGEELKTLCVSVPLSAGEAVLFDHRLLHWSRPNGRDLARPVLRLQTAPRESRMVFYKLDAESGGRRFEILDAEQEGAVTHSPDDVAAGNVPAAPLGYVDNPNRDISFDECRRRAIEASPGPRFPFTVQRAAAAMKNFRARLGA